MTTRKTSTLGAYSGASRTSGTYDGQCSRRRTCGPPYSATRRSSTSGAGASSFNETSYPGGTRSGRGTPCRRSYGCRPATGDWSSTTTGCRRRTGLGTTFEASYRRSWTYTGTTGSWRRRGGTSPDKICRCGSGRKGSTSTCSLTCGRYTTRRSSSGSRASSGRRSTSWPSGGIHGRRRHSATGGTFDRGSSGSGSSYSYGGTGGTTCSSTVSSPTGYDGACRC